MSSGKVYKKFGEVLIQLNAGKKLVITSFHLEKDFARRKLFTGMK